MKILSFFLSFWVFSAGGAFFPAAEEAASLPSTFTSASSILQPQPQEVQLPPPAPPFILLQLQPSFPIMRCCQAQPQGVHQLQAVSSFFSSPAASRKARFPLHPADWKLYSSEGNLNRRLTKGFPAQPSGPLPPPAERSAIPSANLSLQFSPASRRFSQRLPSSSSVPVVAEDIQQKTQAALFFSPAASHTVQGIYSKSYLPLLAGVNISIQHWKRSSPPSNRLMVKLSVAITAPFVSAPHNDIVLLENAYPCVKEAYDCS